MAVPTVPGDVVNPIAPTPSSDTQPTAPVASPAVPRDQIFVTAGKPEPIDADAPTAPAIFVPAGAPIAPVENSETLDLARRMALPVDAAPIVTRCGFPTSRFAINGGRIFRRVVRLVGSIDALAAEADTEAEDSEESNLPLALNVLLYVVRTEHEQEDIDALATALALRFAAFPDLPALVLRDKRGVYTRGEFVKGYIFETVAIAAEELALVNAANAAKSAQDDRGATEGTNADTRAVAVRSSEKRQKGGDQ